MIEQDATVHDTDPVWEDNDEEVTPSSHRENLLPEYRLEFLPTIPQGKIRLFDRICRLWTTPDISQARRYVSSGVNGRRTVLWTRTNGAIARRRDIVRPTQVFQPRYLAVPSAVCSPQLRIDTTRYYLDRTLPWRVFPPCRVSDLVCGCPRKPIPRASPRQH
ncbi:hypothetical protein BD309DRAFT_969570 [Dichomitus squalens]|nr:hypothetical protein BD309DRAFT_969570 [Dichomitus squalens]